MGRPRAPAWLAFPASASGEGGYSHDGRTRTLRFSGNHGHGCFFHPKGLRLRWFRSVLNSYINFLCTRKDPRLRRELFWIRSDQIFDDGTSYDSALYWRRRSCGLKKIYTPGRTVIQRTGAIKSPRMDVLQQDLGVAWLSFGGWGDHKELVEGSTRPKPSKASESLWVADKQNHGGVFKHICPG
jgi:hypothetical protein